MTAKLDVIPFHNTEIMAVQIDGQPHVVLRPVFEGIGLDADRQIKNVRRQAWATTSVTAVVAADGKLRSMIVANVRTFLMALATIPASRVNAEARPLLEAYQAEVADVIEAYYSKGAVINPRVSPEQVPGVVDQALADYEARRGLASLSEAQLSMLRMAKDLVDEKWIATKAQVVVARGLGETPVIPQEEMPLYVEEFMKSKGVSQSKTARFSGAFGKKVLDLAKAEVVEVPGKRTQITTDGSIREITAWTKQHLPLFERAWRASYANDPRLMA